MTLGEQMAKARRERGLSLEQVSAAVSAAGVKDERGKPLTLNSSALSRIERGQKFPSLRTMQAVAHALGVCFVITSDGVEVAIPA